MARLPGLAMPWPGPLEHLPRVPPMHPSDWGSAAIGEDGGAIQNANSKIDLNYMYGYHIIRSKNTRKSRLAGSIIMAQ